MMIDYTFWRMYWHARFCFSYKKRNYLFLRENEACITKINTSRAPYSHVRPISHHNIFWNQLPPLCGAQFKVALLHILQTIDQFTYIYSTPDIENKKTNICILSFVDIVTKTIRNLPFWRQYIYILYIYIYGPVYPLVAGVPFTNLF